MIRLFDLKYEGDRYLVLYQRSYPLYLIKFEDDKSFCVYQECFPINIGDMIGSLLISGNTIQAGIELFSYMEEHDTEGGSAAGITTKEELASELSETFLPALEQIAEICGLA